MLSLIGMIFLVQFERVIVNFIFKVHNRSWGLANSTIRQMRIKLPTGITKPYFS